MNGIKARGALAVIAAFLGTSAAQAAPDMSGVWEVATKIQELKTIDGAAPPLKSEAQKIYDENRAKWKAKDLSFDPTAMCISPGLPRVLYLPYPFEIIQTPSRITYLFEWNYWNRHVDMSGKALEAAYPLALGESLGHWEGDTLVIRTNGLRADNTLLDAAGLPHSEDLVVTEYVRLINGGKQLEDRISLEDPKTFTRSWETQVTFNRLPKTYEISMDICLDRTDAGKPAVDWSRPLSKGAKQ
jgi:hypothetical protein